MGVASSVKLEARVSGKGGSSYKSKPSFRDDQAFLDKKFLQSITNFASNPEDCDAFVAFVKSEEWVSKVSISKIRALIDDFLSDGEMELDLKAFSKYNMPPGCAHMITYYITSRQRNDAMFRKNTSGKEEETQAEDWLLDGGSVEISQDFLADARPSIDQAEAITVILLAQLLGIYIKESEEAMRQEHHRNGSMQSTASSIRMSFLSLALPANRVTPAPLPMLGESDVINIEAEADERRKQLNLYRRLRVTDDVITSTVCSAHWLTAIYKVLDEVTLCVCIASARSKTSGFPIIYTNRAFAALSGYSKEEMIGKSCRLLQSDRTEPTQIEIIREALRTAQPARVALTNVHRSGDEFVNLLALQPVFNAAGEYTYVLSVQYDVAQATRTGANVTGDVRRIEDLIALVTSLMSMST